MQQRACESGKTYRTISPNPIGSTVSAQMVEVEAYATTRTPSSKDQWEDYNSYVSLDFTDIRHGKESIRNLGKSVPSRAERSLRYAPHKIRPKFDKISWNGMISTYKAFEQAVEAHLLQVSA